MLTPTSPVTLADYNSAILGGNATHARIVFPVQNVTFTGDDIASNGGITLTQIMNPDVDMVIGKAVASQIVIHFLNKGQFTGFNWTEEFHVDMGVEISGSTNWVTIGYFTGKKPERITRAEVIEFTAIDRMSKFDTLADDFLSTLVYPKTMSQIYSALCTYVGVSSVTGDENSTIMNISYSESPFTNGITCRALLAYIAEANCCYAKITSSGDVKLVWFADQTSNYSINGNNYFAINLDEASVPVIDSVRISNTQDENGGFIYPVGTNDVVYQIVDNPLLLAMTATQKITVVTNITTRFTAIGAYTPVAVSAIGNWMVETGDIIEVGYDNSQTVNMPVFNRTMQWNGGCGDVYELTGKTKRTEVSESAKQQYDIGGQLAKKYTIQSGVDITDQGVTVSGGKFVRIVSGGTFDVDSTNFKIDSINRILKSGNGELNDDGLVFDNTTVLLGENVFYYTNDNFNPYSYNYGDSSGIAYEYTKNTRKLWLNSAYAIYTAGEIEGYNILEFPISFDFSSFPHKIKFGDTGINNVDYYGYNVLPSVNGGTTSIGDSLNQWQYGHFKNLYANGNAVLSTANVYNDLDQTASGYVLDARQGKALDDAVAKCEVLIVNCGTVSSLPVTISNASIESDMRCIKADVGTPRSQVDTWVVTTSNGSVTVSGTISGSTTLDLYLMKTR